MSYLVEQIAFLKGLAEGMQVNDMTNEGKLLKAILDVLNDIAHAIDNTASMQEKLVVQVDELEDSLAEIEKLVFEEEDINYDICDIDTIGVNNDEYADDNDMDIVTEFDCPYCGEAIILEEAFSGNDFVLCPHCAERIEIDWVCDCEDCRDNLDE